MTIFKRTHLLALTLVFSLVALPAVAQGVAQGIKEPPQTTGGITVGGQTGSGLNDSSKLQQYETVFNGASLLDADFAWKNNSRYFLTFLGNRLGLDDQSASLRAGQKGSWQFSVSLDQNPRWFSNTAETLYNQSSPGVFTLSDAMRSSLQRIWYPMSTDPKAPADSNDPRFWSVRDSMSGAQPVDLRYLRRTSRAAFDVTALEHWTFTMAYQRETRGGTQPVAFTAGPGIDEVANPIQYTTQDARAEVEYANGRVFLNGAFARNDFTNDVPYTTIDNPVRLNNTDYFWSPSATLNSTNTNSIARLWNAPDNTATSFDVTGGIRLPARHKATFTASTTSMTMERALIPQATNPFLNLATTSADYGKFSLTPEYPSISGDLLQKSFIANFSGDPHSKVGYSAFYRTFDLADKKSTYTFHSTVNSDGGASYSATGITTGDASFDNAQMKVEGHFMPVRGLRFGINAGHQKTNFAERDYLDVTDNTVGVTVDANHTWASLHGGYTRLRRAPGAANPTAPAEGTTGGPLDINAEMKDVAKQDGKLYNAALTLTPLDKAALTFSVQGIDSDFPETSIGLKKSTVKNYGVDLVYALTDRFSANAGYIYETYHMDSNFWYGANGTVAKPAADNVADRYFNAINDKVDTYSVGLRWSLLPRRVDVGSDYSYSKGRSDSGFTTVPGGVAGGDLLFPTNTTTVNFTQAQYLNYPQVFSATTIWKTWFNYHVDGNITVGLMYWHQKFDQADWATDNLSLYMMPGSALYAATPGAVAAYYPQLDPSANRALILGATVPNYKANIVRASISYRF